MDRLGTYTVTPDLFGGIQVQHTVTDLCGHYDNEAAFKHKMQKSDWQRMMIALLSLLGIANKINMHGYLPSNHNRSRFLSLCATYAAELPKDPPNEQAEKLRYITDHTPRIATTRHDYLNKDLLKEIAIVREYYDRYLLKWEVYNKPELTA